MAYADIVEENQELRARIRELEQLLAGPRQFPTRWGLTPTETAIASLLYHQGRLTYPDPSFVSAERIMLIYPSRTADGLTRNTLSVMVTKIRRKISDDGLAIESRRSLGYRFTKTSMEILMEITNDKW